MQRIYGCLMAVLLSVFAVGCQDDEAELDAIIVPSNLEVSTVVEDGQTGNVSITPSADNALTFHVFFTPNAQPQVLSPGETAMFRYTQSGQYDVNVTVVAYGKGGVSSSTSVSLSLDVRLFIDAETLQLIGGDGSKRWVWDSGTGGHFGVGPTSNFFPEFFSATPNGLNPCTYDDVLTFSYDANDNYSFELDPGEDNLTFINWTEVTGFFPDAMPQEFVDECRDITDQILTNTSFVIFDGEEGNQLLSVENSTLSYFAGVVEYQILELSANKLSVRGVQEVPAAFGGGELAWYHVFVPEVDGTEESGFNELVWSDEFETNGAPNPQNWTYDIGTGDNGWGNGESQYYTDRPDNIIVEDGLLKITAQAETFNGSDYTSSRIKSQDLFEFTYGRVEVRAKLPQGGGTWPAIWMLGADFDVVGWPTTGEIDIMEHTGNNQDIVSSALHFPGNSGGNAIFEQTTVAGASSDFHIYSVEWTESTIIFSVDDTPYHTFTNSTSVPFNKDFFLILNVAMGGSFGGSIDPAFTESTMEVDYVRVYQ